MNIEEGKQWLEDNKNLATMKPEELLELLLPDSAELGSLPYIYDDRIKYNYNTKQYSHPELRAEQEALNKQVEALMEGLLEEVYSEGGGEGGGEAVEHVLKHVPTGRFFQKTGFYASYDGTSWNDGWTEVFPYTFTETRYKAK